MWTVEWFDDRKKRVLTETSSTCPIAVAQPFASPEQHKGRKRKRDFERSLATKSASQDAIPTLENQDKHVQSGPKLGIEVVDEEREHSSVGPSNSYSDDLKTSEVQTQLAESNASDNRDNGSSIESMDDGEHRFFLLKPRTSSSKNVLIPLTPDAILGDCLKGRTVLEFPTVYVFPNSSQQLPEEFMLEEDYLRQEGEEQKEFDALLNELDPEILKRLKDDGQRSGGPAKEEVDSREILDVLKKDFGSLI
jgi:hypothetical protein